MDYYRKLWYNKKEEVKEAKYLVMLDLEEKELKEFAKNDREVNEYMEKLENLNSNPEFYQYMTHEEDERKIHNSMMYEAEQKGLEKGIEQGLEQGIEEGKNAEKIATATNFKNLGIDIETISKATGLSKEEIEKL